MMLLLWGKAKVEAAKGRGWLLSFDGTSIDCGKLSFNAELFLLKSFLPIFF